MRVSAAELVKGSFNLLFLNGVVLFILTAPWKTLPWQGTLHEVKEHVADGFEIVTTGLFDTLVSGDRSVSGGSR